MCATGGGGEVVFNRVGLPLWRLGRPYLGTEIIYKYTIILGGQGICLICYYDLCRVWYHGVYVGGVCGRTWLCAVGVNESGGNWGKVLLVWGFIVGPCCCDESSKAFYSFD